MKIELEELEMEMVIRKKIDARKERYEYNFYQTCSLE